MAVVSRRSIVRGARTVERAGRAAVRRARSFVQLVRDAATHFGSAEGASNGAAVAFFAVLSAAPLMLLAVAVAGVVYGTETARRELNEQLTEQIGPDVASVLGRLMDATAQGSETGSVAGGLGIAVLLWGAARFFVQLQRGLNALWGVRQRRGLRMGRTLLKLVRKRLTSFAMVLLCGVALTLLVALQTALAAVANVFRELIPYELLWYGLNLVVSFGLFTLLFAVLYRALPDARIGRNDVWVGALFTSVAVGVGVLLIGLYLGYIGISSTYGAAGSLVLLLMWVYYSAQAFYFGAAFTRAWSVRYGTGIQPEPHAVRLVTEDEYGGGARGRDR